MTLGCSSGTTTTPDGNIEETSDLDPDGGPMCIEPDTSVEGKPCGGDDDCKTGTVCLPGACDLAAGRCVLRYVPNDIGCETGGSCLDGQCCGANQ